MLSTLIVDSNRYYISTLMTIMHDKVTIRSAKLDLRISVTIGVPDGGAGGIGILQEERY